MDLGRYWIKVVNLFHLTHDNRQQGGDDDDDDDDDDDVRRLVESDQKTDLSMTPYKWWSRAYLPQWCR